MQNRGKDKSQVKRPSGWKAFAPFSLLLTSCFILFGQFAYAYALRSDRSFHQPDAKALVSPHAAPFFDAPLYFADAAEQDDYEFSEDEFLSGSGRDFSAEYSVADQASRFVVDKISFLNFISGLEKRKPVPLVILHHSWKSFLS